MSKLSPEKAQEEAIAVQRGVKALAKKELKEKPEAAHYKRASAEMDLLGEAAPQLREDVIKAAVEGEQLERKVGKELSQTYNEVATSIGEEMKGTITEGLRSVIETSKATGASPEETANEVTAFGGRVWEKMEERLRKSPRIKDKFAGNEEALEALKAYGQRQLGKLLGSMFEAVY